MITKRAVLAAGMMQFGKNLLGGFNNNIIKPLWQQAKPMAQNMYNNFKTNVAQPWMNGGQVQWKQFGQGFQPMINSARTAIGNGAQRISNWANQGAKNMSNVVGTGNPIA